MIISSRRSFIAGLMSALAAPAIVHAGNLMPVKQMLPCVDRGYWFGLDGYWYYKTTSRPRINTQRISFDRMPPEDVCNIPLAELEFHNARRNVAIDHIKKVYGRFDLDATDVARLAAPPSAFRIEPRGAGIGSWDSPYYDPLAPRETRRI